MRIIAIDYGDQRTGIAVSDMTGTIAGEAFVIKEWDPERLADKIAAECQSRGAERVVLGNPLNMDGSAGPRAEKSRGGPRYPLGQRPPREEAKGDRGRGGGHADTGKLPGLAEINPGKLSGLIEIGSPARSRRVFLWVFLYKMLNHCQSRGRGKDIL